MEKQEMVKMANAGYAAVLSNPLINDHNIDSADNLQNVIESILTKINNGKITKNSFCMISPENMIRYLIGGIKLQCLKIKQSNDNLISFEEVSNDYGHSETQITKKTDLFQFILEQKIFNKEEKELITLYHIEQKTYKEVSKELKKTFKQIRRMVKAVNRKIGTLPIKDVINDIWYQPSASKIINHNNPYVIPLPHKSLLKKAVRQGDKQAMREYRKQAKLNLTKQPNKGAIYNSLYPSCPVDCRLPDTYRPKRLALTTDLWITVNDRSGAQTYNHNHVVDTRKRDAEITEQQAANRARQAIVYRHIDNRWTKDLMTANH